MINKNSLGCGYRIQSSGQFCGIPDGWGQEHLCQSCKIKLRDKWNEEDRTHKDPRIREIHKLREEGKLNY